MFGVSQRLARPLARRISPKVSNAEGRTSTDKQVVVLRAMSKAGLSECRLPIMDLIMIQRFANFALASA